MTVCFNENIYIKTFDEYGYYPLKLRKCKDFDGPNNFSILWNQLLILLDNDLIKDEITLCEKFNSKIILEYKNDILNEIDSILYKFIKLKFNNIKLYNSYTIDNSKDIIIKLMELYRIIYNLL
jgi:hypothetical protein